MTIQFKKPVRPGIASTKAKWILIYSIKLHHFVSCRLQDFKWEWQRQETITVVPLPPFDNNYLIVVYAKDELEAKAIAFKELKEWQERNRI